MVPSNQLLLQKTDVRLGHEVIVTFKISVAQNAECDELSKKDRVRRNL
jgi:hypothetical protein